MRQAGRSLPEYRKLRAGTAMLDACRSPDLVTEITLQPVRRYGVDAAILFSDIVVPLKAIGVDLDIKPGVGPVIARPIRTAADLDQLRPLEPTDVGFIVDAIGQLTAELGATPLIGFAGAPFTLASYLVEGGPSKQFERTKALLFGEPETWDALMTRLVDLVAAHLTAQAEAGAQALQLFDSWVGALHPAAYRRSVAPHVRALFDRLAPLGVPLIHFGVGTGELLTDMAAIGGDVIGIDWRTPLEDGWARAGGPGARAVQGNLDPGALLAPREAIERETRAVLAAAGGRDGHIFNLGHGVLPATPVEHLQLVVDLVHEETQRDA
jgi:uroporphyrinogen decarboxylase